MTSKHEKTAGCYIMENSANSRRFRYAGKVTYTKPSKNEKISVDKVRADTKKLILENYDVFKELAKK